MCGIFGVIGSRKPVDDVLAGLERLEYRGYDSSGIASIYEGRVTTAKQVGKLNALRQAFSSSPLNYSAKVAIGHTRWATHGAPTHANAHPHIADDCAVVHNGIIENHQALKTELMAKGYVFESQTDTEVIPALITHFLRGGKTPLNAIMSTLKKIEGAFALGVIMAHNPDVLYAARRGSPLLVGHGTDGENYLASDAIAAAPFTNKVTYLKNDDIAEISPQKVVFYGINGTKVTRTPEVVDVKQALAGKEGYQHFMLKEIHEQPHVVSRTLEAYLTKDYQDIVLPELPFDWQSLTQLSLVACGTSYYAAMVARYWFEELAGMPVSVDIASEFRYRNSPLSETGLSVFISQSGETADTLASLELAKQAQNTLAIVNVPTSSIARDAGAFLKTHAGPEIGVASTKAFTTQLIVLALFAIKLAEEKGKITAQKRKELLEALVQTPTRMMQILSQEDSIKNLAKQVANATSAIYLGRGSLYPIALEGALKIKEISYIHAEGAAAGEMKHGLIALVDENMPIIALAHKGPLMEKALSNFREVAARHGRIFLIADEDAAQNMADIDIELFTVPQAHSFVMPLLMTVPLQLLAYHVALLKGTDVDQPRNLAKSVTVE